MVDELLHFLSVKMRTLCHDKVVLLATNNFSSEWIEKSKGFLFEACPSTVQHKIKHTGRDKDAKNIKACLSLFNEAGENIPMFVSYCLDKLPPVGFGNKDISALLGRVEQLASEVSGLRRAIEAQVTVNEDLSVATAAVNSRVVAMEKDRRSTTVPDRRGPTGESCSAVWLSSSGGGKISGRLAPAVVVATGVTQPRTPKSAS